MSQSKISESFLIKDTLKEDKPPNKGQVGVYKYSIKPIRL